MARATRVTSRRTFTATSDTGPSHSRSSGWRTARTAPASFDPLTYAGNLEEIESYWCHEDVPSTPPVHGSGPHQAIPGAGRASGTRERPATSSSGGEATIVDTGPWCVPDVIEGGLMAVGLDWSAVGSVIVTHKHPDHWVGLPTALERAADAVVFAGAADIPHIAAPRPIVAVGAGDRVMGLAMIPTPGHTPGHIAIHDEAAGVLVFGDAIVNAEDPPGLVLLPTSEDFPQTRASVEMLAGLSFDTLLAGHGNPIPGGALEELTEYLART